MRQTDRRRERGERQTDRDREAEVRHRDGRERGGGGRQSERDREARDREGHERDFFSLFQWRSLNLYIYNRPDITVPVDWA